MSWIHYPWEHVAPSAHLFDQDAARALIQAAMTRKVREPARQSYQSEFDEVDREVFAHVGVWVSGWHAGQDGGPVRLRQAGRTSNPAQFFDALCGWRTFLEQLEARFRDIRAESAQLPLHRQIETAGARLLPFIVERTATEDAWYRTLEHVLRWYLEFVGAGDRADVVAEVCSGRFQSWIEPAPEVARATFAELGAVVANPTVATPRDALEAWKQTRVTINRPQFLGAAHQPTAQDGHLVAIDRWDRERDVHRAARLHAALTLCRDSARRDLPLTFDLLAEFQGIVVGAAEVGRFRTGVAWARGGRARYGLSVETQREFEACLEEARHPGTHLAVRAARVYLDVCFFHPFDDGNARLARLALDHVLTAERYALRVAEPLFLIGRSGDDALGAWALVDLVDLLMGPVSF